MSHSLSRFLVLSVGLGLIASPSAAAQTDDDPELLEWDVPWERTRPRDPYVAPDGKIWFVGQAGHYAAFLDRDSGEFTRFELEDQAGPHNLVVAEDGIVWYAGNASRHIGRLDPATGEIQKYPMPTEAARDPHTLVLTDEGDLWFTVQGGNSIGKFWTETGEMRLVNAPEAPATSRGRSSRPYGIKLDSHQAPWIALFNTNLIARVDPETFELTTFALPNERSRPRRLVIDSTDRIWYVDYSLGRLGRLDPETGDVTEWDNPGAEQSRPYGVAIDSDDRVWFVETGRDPNTFVGFDTRAEEFISVTPIGSRGGAIRHMYYEESTNSIWFGTDTNTVGRAKLPPPRQRSVSDPEVD